MENEVAIIETRAIQLAEKIEILVTEARKKVASVANTAQVYTYYEIGRYIVEDEQGGKAKATYGKGVLQRLSERLTAKYGEGWSYANLRSMRQFYLVYSDLLTSGQQIQNADQRSANPTFILPWTHYQIIMREENPQARRFYEQEAYNQQWSKRQLQRQVGSSLYEDADVCQLF